MTVVNLKTIGTTVADRRKAVDWLSEKYGPSGELWKLEELINIKFKNDRDATLFILRWS